MKKRMFLTMLLLLGIIGLAWTAKAAARPPQQPGILLTATPTNTSTSTPRPTVPTATPCPNATITPVPPPSVEPVTSPTDLASQVITIRGRPGQQAVVQAPTNLYFQVIDSSGVARITVVLAPNMTNLITVMLIENLASPVCGRSQNISSTTVDRFGASLNIVQQSVANCLVTYNIQSEWQTGFVADVTIRNFGATPITGWTLGWTFIGDEQIGSMWNAIPAQTGRDASARNADWNRTIAPGGTVNFGFLGSHTTQELFPPAAFTLNGKWCVTEMPTPTSTPGGTPDLVITDFALSMFPRCTGSSTSPSTVITVRNSGNADAGPFFVQVNGVSKNVSEGLKVGQSLAIDFTGVSSSASTAFVDSTNLVAESNENNNQLTRTFPTLTPAPTCTATPTGTAVRANSHLPRAKAPGLAPGSFDTETQEPTR